MRIATGLDIAPVLFGPTCDLALEIVTWATVVREPNCRIVNRMQPRKGRVHCIEIEGPHVATDFRKGDVPEDAAFDVVHHIEPGANHAVVIAEAAHARHR